MKINLRKAKALQTAIQQLIGTLSFNLTVDVGEFDDAEKIINDGVLNFQDKFKAKSKLWQTYYSLRAAVALANTSAGISTLLAEQALSDKLIVETSVLADEHLIVKDLTVLRRQQEKLQQNPSANAYRAFDNLNTGILTPEIIAMANQNLKNLRKQKQIITDRLLELNISTEIELDAAVVDTLKEFDLV